MPKTFCIVTPSYSNDFELAKELCETADRFVDPDIEHILVVPRRDVKLFSSLCRGRRRVVSKEEILDRTDFVRLPTPNSVGIRGLWHRRLKEQWWHPAIGRTSGWAVQQVVKLSAGRLTQADVIIFADSDIAFFRDLTGARFLRGDRTLLHQSWLKPEMTEHLQWYATARRLLGIPPGEPGEKNYIGQLISWNSRNVKSMVDHIERVNGRPWQQVVAQAATVSEYILYGVYCDEVLGMERSDHEVWVNDLVLSFWFESKLGKPSDVAQMVHPSHVALLIQSFIPLSTQVRSQYLRAIAHRLST